jgi:hypothetical protein
LQKSYRIYRIPHIKTVSKTVRFWWLKNRPMAHVHFEVVVHQRVTRKKARNKKIQIKLHVGSQKATLHSWGGPVLQDITMASRVARGDGRHMHTLERNSNGRCRRRRTLRCGRCGQGGTTGGLSPLRRGQGFALGFVEG